MASLRPVDGIKPRYWWRRFQRLRLEQTKNQAHLVPTSFPVSRVIPSLKEPSTMNINKPYAQTSSLFCSAVLAVLLCGSQNSASANVIPVTVVTDTALNLDVTWTGNGLLDDGQNNDSLAVPTLTNWAVGPNPITLTYLGGGNGWTGTLTAQHIVAPHLGEGLGNVVQFNISFDQLGTTNTTTSKETAHGGHKDVYTLTYTYNPTGDKFFAELKGAHVPEPTSFALLSVGAAGMIASRLRRKKND